MMRMWFLTRSLYPYHKTGGGQIREAQVAFFKKHGWDVEVVMPSYELKEIKVNDNITQIPFLYNHKFVNLLEIIGIYEDYLDKWVEDAYTFLKDRVTKKDILFATSGGELGMIKLATQLKEKTGCKVIANFHDPLVYSVVNGHKLQYRFHVSRERVEKRYINMVDLIITSTKSYQKALIQKYPNLKERVKSCYFGYIQKSKEHKIDKNIKRTLSIAYVGTMSETQRPEILYDIIKNCNDVKLYYVGDYKGYKPFNKIEDERVIFIPYMQYELFLEFMSEEIDLGFVSLSEEYFGVCVPSKIFEYINLGLPMLAALPDGDAKDIINDNNYGIACHYKDIEMLKNSLCRLKDKELLETIRTNIKKDRDDWAFHNQYKKVNEMLKKLYKGGVI